MDNNVINTFYNYVVYPVTGMLGMLGIIYGSFLFMTSQGDREQIHRAKHRIWSAIVGMIFNFTILFLIRVILYFLGFG